MVILMAQFSQFLDLDGRYAKKEQLNTENQCEKLIRTIKSNSNKYKVRPSREDSSVLLVNQSMNKCLSGFSDQCNLSTKVSKRKLSHS
jgi:hypothetical protein